jgi:hypothetical protein
VIVWMCVAGGTKAQGKGRGEDACVEGNDAKFLFSVVLGRSSFSLLLLLRQPLRNSAAYDGIIKNLNTNSQF